MVKVIWPVASFAEASAIDSVAVSSLKIVTVAVSLLLDVSMVTFRPPALTRLLSVSVKVSSSSTLESLETSTVNVFVVSPAAKLRVSAT